MTFGYTTEPPQDAESCSFCNIAACYTPFDPRKPPPSTGVVLNPSRTSPNAETYIVLSTPLVIAFLDIAPLAEGHLLLCPRKHREKLTSLDDSEARELGRWLRIMSKALMRAVGVDDWNVVQNNGAAAAQIVPHMHFHIIPRPDIRRQGRWSERFTMFGRGQRTDLDEQEGMRLAEKVRSNLARVLCEEKASDGISRL
ncbi:HIT domain protein [Sporothrix schenckii 1099-18]|uniref:HIT domain protein n=1 Tax=Sporothrix schenckii 1099-18 TaxID=1397361 RepID=A0A0F2M7V0_SPOSC|nr:HIT domain protein [Sporothrix schenckii 1099-18]KJR84900.1 HIT domain protein [Sporothrix schenckii 1099-18]